jgi:uncharacterized protein YoxC
MTLTQDVILILAGLAFLILAGFALPVLLQVLRTARSMAHTLQLLNQSLPGILKNLEEITEGINRTTAAVHRQVEELSVTVKKVQGTVSILVGLEEILRRGFRLRFARTLRASLAVARGVRVFADYLLSIRPEGKM